MAVLNFLDDVTKLGINVSHDVDSSTLNTYRVGGPLAHVITLASRADCENLSSLITHTYQGTLTKDNVVTIGRGSNIIVSDNGFNGVVIVFTDELIACDHLVGQSTIDVSAGVALPVLARQCASYELSGLEFYVGIPGSVGGAVAMNAGGHGKQTSDVLVSTDCIDLISGLLTTYPLEECEYSYRHSRFRSTDLIISAQYNVERGQESAIKDTLQSIVQWRRENQPGGRNVGSIFRNPEHASAGSLIERSGLKGYRVGGAYVSPKHANFIQADAGATARDIVGLISHVQRVVADATGTMLHTEVRLIGMNIDE